MLCDFTLQNHCSKNKQGYLFYGRLKMPKNKTAKDKLIVPVDVKVTGDLLPFKIRMTKTNTI